MLVRNEGKKKIERCRKCKGKWVRQKDRVRGQRVDSRKRFFAILWKSLLMIPILFHGQKGKTNKHAFNNNSEKRAQVIKLTQHKSRLGVFS